MGCVDKKIPCSKNTLLLKKENSTPEHLVFSKIKHSIMLLKKQGKSRHRETPAAPKLPASLYACFLVKGLGNFKPTDEADVNLFFGEDSYSFNHSVYQVEYSVRSRSSAETLHLFNGMKLYWKSFSLQRNSQLLSIVKNVFRKFKNRRFYLWMTALIVECPSAEETLRCPGRMVTIPTPTSSVLIAGLKTLSMVMARMMTNPCRLDKQQPSAVID